MLFEHAESQFDIPSARIQPGDLSQRELLGIEHIGQIAMQPSVVVKLHQPHRILGAVGPVRAQPHDHIHDPITLVEEMTNLHCRVGA